MYVCVLCGSGSVCELCHSAYVTVDSTSRQLQLRVCAMFRRTAGTPALTRYSLKTNSAHCSNPCTSLDIYRLLFKCVLGRKYEVTTK